MVPSLIHGMLYLIEYRAVHDSLNMKWNPMTGNISSSVVKAPGKEI